MQGGARGEGHLHGVILGHEEGLRYREDMEGGHWRVRSAGRGMG